MTSLVKAKREYLRKENKKYGRLLERIPGPKDVPENMTAPISVWRSKDFLAQIFATENKDVLRMTVCRTMVNEVGDWLDGITWDELMALKTECGFGDWQGVEFFPQVGGTVNVANMRHVWLKKHWGFDFVWCR